MRTPSIASVYYVPDTPPADQESFNRYVYDQLNKVGAAVALLAAGHLDKTTVAPTKPRDGDIRYADGSSWNPSAGAGLYQYQGSTWEPLDANAARIPYGTLLQSSASHTAGKVAGTYALSHGDVAAVSGTGTLYPLNTIYIAAADYPATGGKSTKLRLRAQLYTNDVAPTGDYTFGLYPITRPATSGGAGLNIYTLGTVVAGSTVAFSAPAADGLLSGSSGDFSLPADGHYVIGVVTTATVAVSSHVHMNATLQIHNA